MFSQALFTWSDNKVRELATVFLPWQRWTKALVWFDDLTYQRFTVVLLIYVSLFLSGIYYCLRVFWCATARMTEQRKNIKLFVKLGEAIWHFGPFHHRWWNMGLPIRPWNEAAKCTMKDCQFLSTKKFRQSKSRVEKYCWLFYIIRIILYKFVKTRQTVNQLLFGRTGKVAWIR